MNLGEKIQFLRKKNHWSQPALGEKIGTSGPVIGRYERNEITPSIEVAKKMAEAFNITLDYFVDDSKEVVLLSDKQMTERLIKLEKLPEPEKEKILSVLDSLIRDSHAQLTYSK